MTKQLFSAGTDEADIVAVIETETAAFLSRDLQALCDCWVPEPYIQHTTILPYTGMVQVNGIAALRDHFASHFKVQEPLELDAEIVARENWKFVVRENMAWVTFEQSISADTAAFMSGLQMHTRILEKHRIHVDESAMVLYVSEESEKVVLKHPVLKISSGRLTASLPRDAIKLKSAIQRAQKDIDEGTARLPVPLIFGEKFGTESSLCWVAILDMKIVVLFDDVRLIEAAIESAGRLYGLTASQMRVAEEIAKGADLASMASTLELSTNTIRTHIKRIFERVGVNNQKALLKRILGAQAPTIGLHD